MHYLYIGPQGYLFLKRENDLNEMFLGTPLVILMDPHSHLGDGVNVRVKFTATDPHITLENIKMELTFFDTATNDEIYKFIGTLDPSESATNSIMAVAEASQEFKEFSVSVPNADQLIQYIQLCDAFNLYGTLARKELDLNWDSDPIESNVNAVFNILTQLDDLPTRLGYAFTDDVALYTELLRVADHLNIRLLVELDPTLSVDQVEQVAQDLSPFDHRVSFIWNPNLARPLNAQGLQGKLVPRLAIGTLLGRNALRDAQTNVKGIPPYHTPIAGHDYPFKFIGMTKRPDIVLDDTARKRLANVQVNVVERQVFRTGKRFILGDVLTANGDHTSALKLLNSSDISLFIDNTLNAIVMRHLLKGMSTYIEDATKECTKFLDSCVTKDRPLLVRSTEINGYYELSIVPRSDRPFDASDVTCNYCTNGASRAAFSNFAVVKPGQ